MKRILFTTALALSALSASAQRTIEYPEIYDNIYLGVNAGANTNLAINKFFPVNPTFGIRIGKDITPVFGLNIEGAAWFGSHIDERVDERFDYQKVRLYDTAGNPTALIGRERGHNVIRAFNLGVNGTLNLSNLFLGYEGEPRDIEYGAILGFGWGHTFTPHKNHQFENEDYNVLTAKTGLDIMFNLGSEKQHQIYIEPAILWDLNKKGHSMIKMNKHYAFLGLSVGYNYKFGCSNGTHNFKYVDYTQEIARLNAMLDAANSRPAKVETVEKVVYKESPSRAIKVENLVLVTFEQGKSTLTDDAKRALNAVHAGSHVQVIGTASPEGDPERNQVLSENRAQGVAEYLTSRGVIVDSAVGQGVQGNTSNRLAIVYVR